MPGKRQKGETMQDVMTDFQFRAIIQMVINVLKGSSSMDEAIKSLQALLEDKK